MNVTSLGVDNQLTVGEGKPEILGRGPTLVRGSSYTEGPSITGDPSQFPGVAGKGVPTELGSMMAGQTGNVEMTPTPFYAFIATSFVIFF